MPLQKLNRLADTYRDTKSDESFRELYDELSETSAINNSLVIRSGLGDESDALEIFHDVLWRIVGKSVEFGRVFHRSLKNARTDFFRKQARENKRISSIEEMTEWDDYGASTPKVLQSDYSLEDDYFNEIKEIDQRQLIDSLRQSVRTNQTMTSIIETYLDVLPSTKPKEIARMLGLHNFDVDRKLRSLSRKYDVARFGDIRDIIAV